MADTGDIGVGSIIRFNGELCQILEYQHRTPGNLRAFYQAKMRNLRTGRQTEHRFRAGEEVEIVRVEFKNLQFIYKEGNNIVCMDNETFEQFHIPESMFGEKTSLLKEGMEVRVAFELDEPILAEPPIFVELQVTYCEPGVRGDTASSNVMKPATVETGATIMVPLFVNTGDRIKIDTRTMTYVERIK